MLNIEEQKSRFAELSNDLVKLHTLFDHNHATVKKARSDLRNFLSACLLPSPFKLGQSYKLLNGTMVTIIQIHNEGTIYETIEDQMGVNRYSTRDFGRVTGSSSSYSWYIDLLEIDMSEYNGYPLWWKEMDRSGA